MFIVFSNNNNFSAVLFSDMAFEIKSFTDKQQYIKHMYFIRLVTVGFYFLSNLLKNCNDETL